MTLRTRSQARQWMVWSCIALVHLAVYVVFSRILYGVVDRNPFEPRAHRLALPLVVLFVFIARETRWDGVKRKKPSVACGPSCAKVPEGGRDQVGKTREGQVRQSRPLADSGDRAVVAAARHAVCGRSVPGALGAGEVVSWQTRRDVASTEDPRRDVASTEGSLSGEDLFNQARALSHQVIPDFTTDGPYLDLLGRSAAKGYAPAQVKLGEYAMRRAAWVEAYYWMKQAQRNGMHGLTPTLREIRRNWSLDGFSDELSNVNDLYDSEAGSIGRALIHLDSGRAEGKARKFLKATHPEFLA